MHRPHRPVRPLAGQGGASVFFRCGAPAMIVFPPKTQRLCGRPFWLGGRAAAFSRLRRGSLRVSRMQCPGHTLFFADVQVQTARGIQLPRAVYVFMAAAASGPGQKGGTAETAGVCGACGVRRLRACRPVRHV